MGGSKRGETRGNHDRWVGRRTLIEGEKSMYSETIKRRGDKVLGAEGRRTGLKPVFLK